MSRPPFPWAYAMAFGFGTLRLGPRAFWGMTPRELGAAFHGLNGHRQARPIPRERLDALMRTYPDTEHRHGQ